MRRSIELAGGPVSWGVDFAETPGNPPYGSVLDGLAGAGLTWAELGPAGYLPPGGRGRTALARRGLRAVGGFVFERFHDRGAEAAVRDATAKALDAVVACAGQRLILIDQPGPQRAATAGRAAAAQRLDARAWAAMVGRLRGCAAQATERGVRAVVHPHAGGCIEFEDEIERLLADVGADELGLCLDTGHALYAGSDPAELALRYGARVEHLHVKDVDEGVVARGLGFWEAVRAGVFCPVGNGRLDLRALRDALERIGYTGIATVEQDRRPETDGDPGADLRRSVERVRAAGLG